MKPDTEGQADRALARKVLAGSPEATRELLERMRCVPRFLGARNARAGRPLGPEELADLAQEIFATVWRKLGDYRGEAPLEAWVYPFCVLSFMNHARKHIRRPLAVEASELEESATELSAERGLESTDAAEIHLALDKLEKSERQIIELKHFDDLTFEEIAARLELSANTAKTRYYRGLTKLQSVLGPQFFPKERS